jgi:hypothetical protein
MPDIPYVWDDVSKRYRDVATGRFVPQTQVMEWLRQSITSTQTVVDAFAGYVADGSLGAAEFGQIMREQIKAEYIRQYLVGIGGEAQMTAANWGSVGGMLTEQYKYLDKFIAEIASGNLTAEQIMARAEMYINSAHEAWERAKYDNAKELDMDLEGWFVDSALENCPDCLGFQSEGWQPIGHFPFPGAGDTQCLTNCGCRVVYKNSKTGQTYG